MLINKLRTVARLYRLFAKLYYNNNIEAIKLRNSHVIKMAISYVHAWFSLIWIWYFF